jgi:hypothetical protein
MLCSWRNSVDNISVAKTGPVQEGVQVVSDRRRPGRTSYTSYELIGLLRDPTAINDGPVAESLQEGTECDEEVLLGDDPLRTARGIVNGVTISLGCWIAIAATAWLFLKG